MSEVLIDDLNLNKIANSIRRKNGLVRTYKPREMAPAIRAFRNFIPSPHEYNVVINQTPNQRIVVRKFLETNRNNYTGTFTVAEPFYTLDISVEPEIGYVAGQLNCNSPVVLDRDMIIEATPAVYDPDSSGVTTVYTNGVGWGDGYVYSGSGEIYFFEEPECITRVRKNTLNGTVVLVATSDANFIIDGKFLFGCDNHSDEGRLAMSVKEIIIRNIDSSDFNSLYDAFNYCMNVRHIDFGYLWNTSHIDSLENCFKHCQSLRSLNIANWDMSSLITCKRTFYNCRSLQSLDLSGWNTASLTTYSEVFSGCNSLQVLDISNFDTRVMNSGTFQLPSNLRYLIMDDDSRIKFTDLCQCNKPNDYIKYLVPQSMVLEYKSHPKWQDKANNIYAIEDFTIVRSNGEVFVTPND